MSGNAEDKATSSILSSTDLSLDDGFIDDYSHLRLSYHQERGFEDSLTSGSEILYDSNLTDSGVNATCDDNSFENIRELERKKLREYHISQIPDLPPPTYTMASIVSSMSRRMNSGNTNFKYRSQIEQGVRKKDDIEDRFAPSRRSTLNPQGRK